MNARTSAAKATTGKQRFNIIEISSTSDVAWNDRTISAGR
ncbi:hypothetical protein SBA5_110132 [Candidatus Sulfotelmatomonas gaucii]|uniref:Uncharacterized protein n=1 Tax=Candidatus Sulfuritelmatomonas gaucii TaxID=2043161 RepID=A0A2N9L385_9BACT|nr:hypothetical protein SBA5_110132 [Candidatus Sulfotelmatomonas gaucii]